MASNSSHKVNKMGRKPEKEIKNCNDDVRFHLSWVRKDNFWSLWLLSFEKKTARCQMEFEILGTDENVIDKTRRRFRSSAVSQDSFLFIIFQIPLT